MKYVFLKSIRTIKKNYYGSCEENHPVWQASYDNCINKNSWCIHCSGKLPKPSKEGIEEVQLYAQSKGGQCLSLVYENRQKKLEWKCHNPKHKSWLAPTDTVIYKNTCCKECGFEQKKNNKEKENNFNIRVLNLTL